MDTATLESHRFFAHGPERAAAQTGYAPRVRLSSRPLGWRPIHFEHHDAEPATSVLPSGAGRHLILLSLGDGVVERESHGEKKRFRVHTGFVAVYPAGSPIRWTWDKRLSYSLMALEPQFFERVAQESFGSEPGDVELLASEREYDPGIANLAGVLGREVMHGEPGGKLFAESLASILAVHLLRHYTRRSEPMRSQPAADAPYGVERAIRYIQDNHARDIGLSDIARAANLSAYHLTRVFKQVTGLPPYQYLIQARVNAARALLSAGAGRHSLADIASAVGFADQSHLTRHFKRILGVTPRRSRGGEEMKGAGLKAVKGEQ
jgi:AraC family transcriptional regulator